MLVFLSQKILINCSPTLFFYNILIHRLKYHAVQQKRIYQITEIHPIKLL